MPKKQGYQQFQDNGSADVNVTSIPPGGNPTLNYQETLDGGGSYINGTFSGIASGSPKTLGAVGALGDVLSAFTIRNNSGVAFTDFTVQDGSVTLTALDLGSVLKTLASGSAVTIVLPKPMRSVNGAWKFTATAAGGTMASILFIAWGKFS